MTNEQLVNALKAFVVGPSIIKSAKNEKSKAFQFGLVFAGLATIELSARKLAVSMGEKNVKTLRGYNKNRKRRKTLQRNLQGKGVHV